MRCIMGSRQVTAQGTDSLKGDIDPSMTRVICTHGISLYGLTQRALHKAIGSDRLTYFYLQKKRLCTTSAFNSSFKSTGREPYMMSYRSNLLRSMKSFDGYYEKYRQLLLSSQSPSTGDELFLTIARSR